MLRESKAPALYEELFHRHPTNPILTAHDWPYPAHTAIKEIDSISKQEQPPIVSPCG